MHFPTPAVLWLLLASLHLVQAAEVVEVSALDAPPERLRYHPPQYPKALVESGGAENVSLRLLIDLDGSVSGVEILQASRPEFAEAAREAVQRWGFQSGSVGGKPARYHLPVTLAFRTEGVNVRLDTAPLGGASNAVIVDEPSVEYEVAPAYPPELVETPRDGLAVVNVMVDASGAPSDPVVEYASHPAFFAAAAPAVLEWKFGPANRDGRLVAVRTNVVVRFRKDDARLTASDRLSLAQLDQADNYDVAPEPAQQLALVYPYEALLAGGRGNVTLRLFISPEGRVVKVDPEPGSAGDFGAAARAGLARWTFRPATKMDQPVFARVAWQMIFREDAAEFQFDDVTRELLAALRAGKPKFTSARELDERLAPLEEPKPVLPPGTDLARASGEVMIEVIIDRNGRCQLPRIISAPLPEMGYAAATELLRCRFKPPRKGGQPVDVRVKVPFHFAAPRPPESGG